MTKNNTLLAWQSTRRRKLFVAIGLTLFLLLPLRATVTVLHSFSDPEGSYPYGSLLRTGSLLYGMTTGDGGGTGVLFRMNTDGTGFGTLHTFTGGSSDGRLPYGSLTESGAKLFGITYSGGVLNAGTIFTVNTDGTGFSLLHSFTSFPNDGGLPINSLTLAGTKLYGATYSGGSSFNGTIFSINTDGTGYSLLHNFTGGANGGANPLGTLVLSGTKLYGSSCNGGVGNKGTLFSVNTDGTGFSLLHTFTGGVNDGVDPRASLTLVGSKLYGTTIFGGASDAGTLFSINTDGSGFGLLHSFSDEVDDGRLPHGALTLSGSTLYGTTPAGGSDGIGTIYSIDLDGTNFRLLESFSGAPDDGATPLYGELTFSEDFSTLYGMTQGGGVANQGIVFSRPIPELGSGTLLGIGCLLLALHRRRALERDIRGR